MSHTAPRPQHGIVLVSSLLLLLVVTVMALAMFRSFGVQEKIAGNTREKQRALQAAVGTENFAEWWIMNGSNVPLAVAQGSATTAATTCNAVIDANTSYASLQICSNTMASLGITTTSPASWTVGSLYAPPCMSITGSTAAACTGIPAISDTYYKKPEFYITDLGAVATGSGELYQVDAFSYGLSQNTVAVVESTLAVTCGTCNKGGL